ncbi:MAG: phosphoribosyltransferase family protein [Anaerolineaceae bacterium]
MEPLSIPEEFLGEVVASHERIQSVVKRLAKEIFYSIDYVGKVPVLLCLREGAAPFHRDLIHELNKLSFDFESAWLKTRHYYRGTEGTGEVNIFSYEGPELAGRLVIIVEDIIDSSATIVRVCDYLDEEKVARRNICTFLFKERLENMEWRNTGLNGYRHLPEVRHVGLFIEPLFVVGYGLDYREFGRNDKQIMLLTPAGQAWVDQQIAHRNSGG